MESVEVCGFQVPGELVLALSIAFGESLLWKTVNPAMARDVKLFSFAADGEGK